MVNLAHGIRDKVAKYSPWHTQIIVENQCSTPIRLYLARDPAKPSVKNAVKHTAPPQSTYVIHSGWVKEPRATVIIRTGVHEAQVFRVSHNTQLKIEQAHSGLTVTSPDELDMEEYPEPKEVQNNDTVAMVLRGDSFLESRIGARPSTFSAAGVRKTYSAPSATAAAGAAGQNSQGPPPALLKTLSESQSQINANAKVKALPATQHGKPFSEHIAVEESGASQKLARCAASQNTAASAAGALRKPAGSQKSTLQFAASTSAAPPSRRPAPVAAAA